ncbi:MAG: hypothetical protein QE283_09875 [Rhodoferax sp.]|jgi:hypothetical protein|nr:hypothetical protein [Rhodoferax sp.]
MRVKNILSDVTLVIADLEVHLNGELRNSPTLCALLPATGSHGACVVPLNTPDGRPILMNMGNAIALDEAPLQA